MPATDKRSLRVIDSRINPAEMRRRYCCVIPGAEELRKAGHRRKMKRSNVMIKSLKSFVADESGATAIEYALIAALIAVALVTILTNLGTRLSGEFSEISGVLK
jgi:pilus assembly protein Flp/PilA